MSLPKGYKQLEYIQSSGAQYIKSNIIPAAGDRIVLDFQFTTYASDTWACSVYEDASNRWSCGLYQNAFYLEGFSATQTQSVTDRTVFTGDCAKNTTRVLLFFAQNMSSGAYGFSIGKFFSGKYYRSGLLIGNFIPCQNADGEIGLWDDVNSVFYGNAGTGTFIAGPEIVIALDPPTSIEQILTVKLAWSAVKNASFYRVYRDGSLIGETEKLTYADESAEFGQTYIYGITACSGSSESAPTELTVYTREGYAVIRPVVTSANFP